MTLPRIPLTLVAGLAFGCTTVEYGYVGIQPLRNDLGHVIGQKEILRDASTGEEVERLTYFTPRVDAGGKVIGYEEPARGGTVLRNLEGRRVGLRYTDLRSRDTNPRGEGVTFTVAP